jgi:hypothetical protein
MEVILEERNEKQEIIKGNGGISCLKFRLHDGDDRKRADL